MGRIWVLDTETKGTGAEMVPLDKVLNKRAPSKEPIFVPPEPAPREPKPPEPRPPLRFKIVDVMTRAALAEDASARETVSVLEDVRSIVDVNIFVWQPKAEKWRLLTLDEKRTLWDRRRVAPRRSS
jgi:hypothetical protein